MKQTSPISLFLQTGINNLKGTTKKSGKLLSPSRKKQNGKKSRITSLKLDHFSPTNNNKNHNVGRERTPSKSIAIPESPNNMLWFDESSNDFKDNKTVNFTHKKVMTRDKTNNRLNGKIFQQNQKNHQGMTTQQQQQQDKTSMIQQKKISVKSTYDNSSTSNNSHVYIEKWASARRSSSDDTGDSFSRSRSNSNTNTTSTPPQRTPPRITHRNIDHRNRYDDNTLVSSSPNGTRKRRGSKTSSEMRPDNFKRQHLTGQQDSSRGENVSGTSQIDDWGWFVDVPFSQEKNGSPKRNSITRKKDFETNHAAFVNKINNYGNAKCKQIEDLGVDDAMLPSPILSLLTKQLEDNNNTKKQPSTTMSKKKNQHQSKPNNYNNPNVSTTSSTTIGKSNSLLKLWEEVTISKVPSAEQAISKLGSSAKDYLETSNPTLNHVSSFCFEMDL